MWKWGLPVGEPLFFCFFEGGDDGVECLLEDGGHAEEAEADALAGPGEAGFGVDLELFGAVEAVEVEDEIDGGSGGELDVGDGADEASGGADVEDAAAEDGGAIGCGDLGVALDVEALGHAALDVADGGGLGLGGV